MAKELPIGVRLNNPGNIEWGSPWEGLVKRELSRYFSTGTKQQQRFCEFTEPAFGIRALALTLITYYDKRLAADGTKIDTVREAIARWAPSFENNVEAYASAVAKQMGVHPDQMINFKDYDTIRGLVVGIIAHENGGYAYPAAVVDEGLRRAGVVKKTTAPVPVNTTTVAGAAVPVAAGIATLAPLAEPLANAIKEQQDNLSSGSWIRIGIGAVLVICAITVAVSQYRKHSAGAL